MQVLARPLNLAHLKLLLSMSEGFLSVCVCEWCVCVTGKLGHGDTNRVYRPKVIEALHGFIIRKVCAGSQSSLALTSAGQVYTTTHLSHRLELE